MKKFVFETNIPKIYMIVMIAISTLLIGSYFSYALFTVNKEKKNAITIITGSLTSVLKIDGVVTNKLRTVERTVACHTFELSNPNSRRARFNLARPKTPSYLIPNSLTLEYMDEEGYDVPPPATGVILEPAGQPGSSEIYRICVRNNTEYGIEMTIVNQVGLDYNDLSLPENYQIFGPETAGEMVPVLASNMIPVKYDGANWIKTDQEHGWYDYKIGQWANAVTVRTDSRAGYLSANLDTEIKMSDIETMWVWIPRYGYTMTSMDGMNYYGKQGKYLDNTPTKALPGEIDVRFLSPYLIAIGDAIYAKTEEPTNWFTPPAFMIGKLTDVNVKQLSGIWVSKFETSNLEGQYESNNSNLTPIVKPNVTSWRNGQVATFATAAQNMTKENNRYGFDPNTVDIHMAKNTEWASVAYLSQSKYGKLGNTSYSGVNKEIYNNNYSGYLTGCSSGLPSAAEASTCAGSYDNLTDRGNGTGSIGGGASTTGNVYGIYDMNGGANEYMMANYNGYSGGSAALNSGYTGTTQQEETMFTGIPFPKTHYYDNYVSYPNSITNVSYRLQHLGHSLVETMSWYDDRKEPFYGSTGESPGTSWIKRGGSYNEDRLAGIFAYQTGTGSSTKNTSFRLVLTAE